MIYDDKPVLRAIIDALGAEMDELNQAIIDCKNNRWIDKAEGKQLDGIGEIVVRPRQIDKALALSFFGFYHQNGVLGFRQARFLRIGETSLASYVLEDAEYRFILATKAQMNVTRCTAEDTISSIKYVYQSPRVFLEEVGNANIAVAIGKKLTPNEKALGNAIDMIVRAGGIGIQYKAFFDGTPFGFLGQPNILGFDEGFFVEEF